MNAYRVSRKKNPSHYKGGAFLSGLAIKDKKNRCDDSFNGLGVPPLPPDPRSSATSILGTPHSGASSFSVELSSDETSRTAGRHSFAPVRGGPGKDLRCRAADGLNSYDKFFIPQYIPKLGNRQHSIDAWWFGHYTWIIRQIFYERRNGR